MTDNPNDAAPSNDGENEIRALVAAAEEVAGPLDGLIEKAKGDVGHPFRDDIINALAELREADRPAFERLRDQLKHAGIRVAEIDKELDALPLPSLSGDGGDTIDSADPSHALADMTLFHTPDGHAFAAFDVKGHRETLSVDSRAFSDRLTQSYFTANAEPPSSEKLRQAISLARARGKDNEPAREVYVRVAALDDKYFLDLGDPDWQAVEITRSGWRIIARPPIHFIRFAGYAALPEPQRGGAIDLLRKHVSLSSDDAFVLVICWLLSALRPMGPYPVLAVNGEQGSAKSTLSRCLRALVDPNTVPLRSMPKREQDLMISATRAHLLAFDNISRISSEMSDVLCRVCTGGGFATRALFTDAEETLLKAQRPVLLNGIDDVVVRPDLAQRTIALELQSIKPEQRRTIEVLDKAFEADRPFILGALLDIMVHGLRHLDDVIDRPLPRMADAARWMQACEGAVWIEGTVMNALERNAREASHRLVERMPVVTAILDLMKDNARWEGTASQLLAQLSRFVDEATRRSNEWPKGPNRLGYLLQNRLRPLLREFGIEISGGPRAHARKRIIVLERVDSKVDNSQ